MLITQPRYRALTQVVFTIVIVVVAACAQAPATPQAVYTTVSQGDLDAGEAIPTPEGDPMLTVSGKIGTTNVEDTIQMDLATIESVGEVDYTVDDPFENRSITYRGPLVSELLNVWQVPEDATTLHMVALNDYAVDVPIADLRQYPVVFALQADGEYMPVATRGPAMLVYPYNDFEFDKTVYNDYWIWQIASLEVR
jgi:hypothetical protein